MKDETTTRGEDGTSWRGGSILPEYLRGIIGSRTWWMHIEGDVAMYQVLLRRHGVELTTTWLA